MRPPSPVLLLLLLLLLIAAMPLSAAGQERPTLSDAVRRYLSVDAPTVALTHVRLVDGTGAPPREDQTIVIDGATIRAVGPTARTAVPAGAQVLDLSGHTVIPGLVSLHEHTYFGGVTPVAPATASGPIYLAMGVTTGMTAGSQLPYQELSLKRMIDLGVWPGPRLHITGPYLTGGRARPGPVVGVTDRAQVSRIVEYWAAEGATWFKILDGPPGLVEMVVAEAHARGLRVTGHLCSATFTEAAALGIDALQHGFITNSEYVPGKAPGVCPDDNMLAQADVDVGSPEVRESIRRIVESGTAVVSTLAAYETFVVERAHLDPRTMELLHPGIRAQVEANHAGRAESPFIVPERLLRKMMEWDRAFVKAGGLLGAGSDPWGTGLLPGFGNLRNYELLVEGGFTPEQAIRIMTLNGATILGEETRIGSVEPGKNADLVVIRGDPLATPSTIYDVTTVFRDGLGYDSARLLEAWRGSVGAF